MKKWLCSLFFGCLAIIPAITFADNHVSQRILIVYFSYTGNTDYIARELQKKPAQIFSGLKRLCHTRLNTRS